MADDGRFHWPSGIGRRRGRPESGLDIGTRDDPALIEALREAARAEARAEIARTRAIQLSRHLVTGSTDERDIEPTIGPSDDVALTYRKHPRARRAARMPRPRPGTYCAGAALTVAVASLAVAGYVAHYHHRHGDERHRADEFAAAARQRVTALMSIDATKARDGVQHIIDDSTGTFKTGILLGAEDLVKAVETSKVSTQVAVKAVAVESMTADSAVVLVAATAQVADPGPSKPPPRSWRVLVTMQRVGGELKIAKAESLP